MPAAHRDFAATFNQLYSEQFEGRSLIGRCAPNCSSNSSIRTRADVTTSESEALHLFSLA
jgi:hypothetical protein